MSESAKRDNSGLLWRNTDKQGAQPDYRGKATIAGLEYKLSGWIRDGKKGKFLSLAFTLVDDNEGRR